ncbi:hypothetical protein [Robertkochia aurantiaca]|uniref:hypothetical protein n=1 Tax=Robertkochia aurantiaca TaxID=2873700 RepID=UPI001CCC5D2E|nr:hypothetical protein [Robertkochia sp. 3YJGBD-33]
MWTPKFRALLFNFLSFVVLFLFFRFLLFFFFPEKLLPVLLGAAIVASLLSPKFAAVKHQGKETVKMKWIFLKGIRDLG